MTSCSEVMGANHVSSQPTNGSDQRKDNQYYSFINTKTGSTPDLCITHSHPILVFSL